MWCRAVVWVPTLMGMRPQISHAVRVGRKGLWEVDTLFSAECALSRQSQGPGYQLAKSKAATLCGDPVNSRVCSEGIRDGRSIQGSE